MIGWFKTLVWRLRGYETIGRLRQRGVKIGERTHLGPGCLVDTAYAHLLTVGDDVTIAPRVMIYTHDASTNRVLHHSKIARVVIGNRVFIGSGAIIMPGVTIADDTVIAAGSIVTRDVPAGCVVGGNPARTIVHTAELIKRHERDLQVRPVWDGYWRSTREMPSAMQQEQRDALIDGFGFSG